MTREFIKLSNFIKEWEKLGLNDNDLQKLEYYLCIKPDSGEVIPTTGGIRKLRWKLNSKGKRSGIRIIYIDFGYYKKLYLISAYPKNAK